MAKKPILILFICLVAIFILGKYTTWQFERWRKSLPAEFPKIKEEEIPSMPELFQETPFGNIPLPFSESIPYLEILPPEFFPQPKEQPEKVQPKEPKEFITPDRKLKIKYPPNWVKLEIENLQKSVPEELTEKLQYKILFVAIKFTTKKAGQISIDQMVIDSKMELKEVTEEIKKSAKEHGWEMEIIHSQEKENELPFEVIYKKIGFPTLHSIGKIFSLKTEDNQKKVFLVEITFPDKDWQYAKKEAEAILETIQILE